MGEMSEFDKIFAWGFFIVVIASTAWAVRHGRK